MSQLEADNPLASNSKSRTLEERFWAKVDKDGPFGCWLWRGATQPAGYGIFRVDHRNVYAHRVSYELLKESLLPGLQVDHLCRVRNCVNPEHLEAVTMQENIRRGISPAALNARKTHCKRGHELLGANLAVIKSNGRTFRGCRECARAKDRRRYWELKASI